LSSSASQLKETALRAAISPPGLTDDEAGDVESEACQSVAAGNRNLELLSAHCSFQ
jgi:hypothetical protein